MNQSKRIEGLLTGMQTAGKSMTPALAITRNGRIKYETSIFLKL